MLEGYNQAKTTKEYIIQYFAFYYNSAYIVYKDAKYSINQQLKKLILNQAKAIQELENK